MTVEISDSLKARIEAIAARSTMSPSEIVADLLENGRSLDWLEHYFDDVEHAIAEADRGEFVSEDEINRVLNKYRPT